MVITNQAVVELLKKEAIDFAEFIKENDYTIYEDKYVVYEDDKRGFYTTEELYILFLKTKNL